MEIYSVGKNVTNGIILTTDMSRWKELGEDGGPAARALGIGVKPRHQTPGMKSMSTR